jgi:hypothetical protein
MSDTPPILDTISIKEPCSASWAKMSGDERARHCRACSLTVFNISAMTREEAETLVREKEGRLCARFYRRPDGTILTADCGKVIKQQRRRKVAIGLAAAASLFAVAFGASGNRVASEYDEFDYGGGGGLRPTVARVVGPFRGVPVIGTLVNRFFPLPIITMGKMVMGDVCVPSPPPVTPPTAVSVPIICPEGEGPTMGEVYIPSDDEMIMGRIAESSIVPPAPENLPTT